eukprot:Skav210506  [mRNA]  locus=scaffold601:448656:468862:+ [translate_table: standard]
MWACAQRVPSTIRPSQQMLLEPGPSSRLAESPSEVDRRVRKRLQALQLGVPAGLVGALVALLAAAVNGELLAVAAKLQRCPGFGACTSSRLDISPLIAAQRVMPRELREDSVTEELGVAPSGCTVGFFKLLEAWLPNGGPFLRGPVEEQLGAWQGVDPGGLQGAVKAHKLKELHKTTEACEQVPADSRFLLALVATKEADLQTGDLVVLASSSTAVVCDVTALDCKVAVLDPSRTFKVEELHVKSSEVRLIHKDWRIGSRHIIGGLQSSRMKHLNGLSACVREHRRYGHPCFIGDHGSPKLRLCVRWEDPARSDAGALLLEPRFLSPAPEAVAPPSEAAPDTTLLTAKRRMTPNWQMSCQAASLGAIDEVEPTTVCSLLLLVVLQTDWLILAARHGVSPWSTAQVESALSVAPGANCSASFLGVLSWMVGAHTRRVEEELSWLLPISEHESWDDSADLVSESTERLFGITEALEQGDLVILERGFQQFALCPGVVKGVDGSTCHVAVLDDSRSVLIGECHVAVSDVALVHSDWRLGTRVVLGGLQSSHMTHLNGLSAVICPHKRHGHPCFVQKPSSPQTGEWLTLCIRFDDPSRSSMHAVLLEPRFLAPAPTHRREAAPGPSPRLECFTPSSTATTVPTVPRSTSLNESRHLPSYSKLLSNNSQGSPLVQLTGGKHEVDDGCDLMQQDAT